MRILQVAASSQTMLSFQAHRSALCNCPNLPLHGSAKEAPAILLTYLGVRYDSRNNIVGYFDFDIGGSFTCVAAQPFLGLWAYRWDWFGVVDIGDIAGDGGRLATHKKADNKCCRLNRLYCGIKFCKDESAEYFRLYRESALSF